MISLEVISVRYVNKDLIFFLLRKHLSEVMQTMEIQNVLIYLSLECTHCYVTGENILLFTR